MSVKTKEIMHLMYLNNFKILKKLEISQDIDVKKYNKHASKFNAPILQYKSEQDLPQEQQDKILQSAWLMPAKYSLINIEDFLIAKCNTREEQIRVQEELSKYKDQNLLPLLQYMIFLVDTLRQNNIIWGVGRGSSVSSFVLYLIGINRINPIKYNLNFHEFLK